MHGCNESCKVQDFQGIRQKQPLIFHLEMSGTDCTEIHQVNCLDRIDITVYQMLLFADVKFLDLEVGPSPSSSPLQLHLHLSTDCCKEYVESLVDKALDGSKSFHSSSQCAIYS